MEAMLCSMLLSASAFTGIHGQMYEQTLAIFQDRLNKAIYKPEVAPVSNQSETMKVYVEFTLVSIVSVDEATQSITSNGLLHFYWNDQRVRWNPDEYGGRVLIHPLPKEVWRPRVALVNTLEARDPFGDDVSPVLMFYDGKTNWIPGSLLTTSCSLSLLKYPFDEQICTITLLSMGCLADELEFEAGSVILDFYNENGEWQLDGVTISTYETRINFLSVSGFEVHVSVRRRPMFHVLNVILPFIILSFLNMLVFAIPQESGEKVGYGITILLALSVFFSIIGGMLPRSSNTVPYVIIYLFALYVISVLTVLDSIVITFLHHKDETISEDYLGNAAKIFLKTAETISTWAPKKVRTEEWLDFDQHDDFRHFKEVDESKQNAGENGKKEMRNQGEEKYKKMAARLNFISYFIFIPFWLLLTSWFFISVLS